MNDEDLIEELNVVAQVRELPDRVLRVAEVPEIPHRRDLPAQLLAPQEASCTAGLGIFKEFFFTKEPT